MRVSAGTAATAGAPAAVISSGSRGVDMARGLPGQRAITQVACDTASSGSTPLRWLACVTTWAEDTTRRPRRHSTSTRPRSLIWLPGRRRREGEGRPAEHAAAAAAEPDEAAVAALADDAPRAARAVEELDADAGPLRGVGAVGDRDAHAHAPGRARRIARVDRRPRGRAELGRRARGDGDEGRERREPRRGAPRPGRRERTDAHTPVTVSSRSPRRTRRGPRRSRRRARRTSGGGRGGRPGRRGATRT